MEGIYTKLIYKSQKKIIGAARNYLAVGADPVLTKMPKPFFFFKPWSGIVPIKDSKKAEIIKVNSANDVIPEIELGVMIGKNAKNVKSNHEDFIGGYFLCMDITDHTILKEDPMGIAFCKGQDTFTPVGKFLQKSDFKDPYNLDLVLYVNGKERIKGNTGEMIYNISKMIEIISEYMTLEQGDLILTGTPNPPGNIKNGDKVHAMLKENSKIVDELHIDVHEA